MELLELCGTAMNLETIALDDGIVRVKTGLTADFIQKQRVIVSMLKIIKHVRVIKSCME